MDSRSFFASFKPHPLQTSTAEKLRSGIAGGLAILLLTLALQYLPQTGLPLLIVASMAASATLLYATPHSPLSQPWNLVGGHIVSALAGLACSALIPEPALAAGAAVGLAILLMQFLNCLHPPSAATALMMVLGSSQFHVMQWQWALLIVAINAGISLLLALAINNLLPGRRYPMHALPVQAPPKPAPFIALEERDLKWALERMDSAIDVSEEDLAEIYKLALQSAQARTGSRHATP
ncbi:MAG: HPP family protein [Nitrosomonadales bacterium]|nr:HPP family protein [Nitrosomonadales bacterium]